MQESVTANFRVKSASFSPRNWNCKVGERWIYKGILKILDCSSSSKLHFKYPLANSLILLFCKEEVNWLYTNIIDRALFLLLWNPWSVCKEGTIMIQTANYKHTTLTDRALLLRQFQQNFYLFTTVGWEI